MGQPSLEDLFAEEDGVAVLMRSRFVRVKDVIDGLQTSLGSVATWPSSFKSAFGVLSSSCCPMFLVWDCDPKQHNSSERVLFYNEPYRSLLQETQPLTPLSQSATDNRHGDWNDTQVDVDHVFMTGQSLQREKHLFSADCNGRETCYTWAYSAIWDEAGHIRGVFATGGQATTGKIIATAPVEECSQAVQESWSSQQLGLTPTAQASLRQAEAALRESEARFEAFMSYSPTSAWITNQEGRILYLSPTYFQMFQFSQQDAVGKQIHDIYSEEFAQQFLENNRRVFQTGQVLETVETAPRSDGSIGSFLVYKFPIAQASGEMLLGGVAIDITEHKRTEDILRRREEELRLITNALPALIAYVDKDHYYRFNNQTYEVWFGQPATSFTGKHVREVLGDAAYVAIRPYMEQAFLGQRVSFESQIAYSEGGIRYIKADYVPHINSQGEVEGYFSLVSDISDRRQADAERERLLQELASERAQFEAVLRKMPEGVIIAAAPSGNLILANERTSQILRHSYELNLELEAYDPLVPFHACHPDGRIYAPDEYPLVRSLRMGEVVTHEEMEIHYEDGSQIVIDASSSPIFDSQGQITSAIALIQDITERTQAAQEREKLLEREQSARRAAEQANRIKDEFLAVLSHELRSPLNPILGWAKLLQTRHFDESGTKRALETIERNAKLQTQLIDDLLDVSRILRGKMVLNVFEIDVVTVVDAALETVRLSAEAKNIDIHIVAVGTIEPISGDSGRLQQVMWNLLSNAIKFTPAGGHIDIRLEQVGTNAQIQIRDTGKGITPEFLPHVFEYFRQEDSTTTRKFGGLGLGLSIVRYLTELHGGTVQAESLGEGLGATFTVLLPVSRPRHSL